MNSFLLCIYAGVSYIQRRATVAQESIDPTNYFLASLEMDGWAVFTASKKFVAQPEHRADIVSKESLSYGLDILSKLYEKIGERAFDVMSLTYVSCHHYARHQFASALLISWSVIELLQNQIWSEFITSIDKNNGGYTTINRSRKDSLNGRDFTASIISQVLSMTQKYDDDTLERINRARQSRNEFAHELSPMGSEDARKTIVLSADLISRLSEKQVACPLGLTYWV